MSSSRAGFDRSFRAQLHVISAQHGDRTVLLDAQAEKYYSLNATGRLVWDLLCDGTTSEFIVDDLFRRFGGDRSVLVDDVQRLLDHLMSRGLVVEQ